MNKCKIFCNSHCCYDCPNLSCDAFEERYDLSCIEGGYERIDCKECQYNDKYMTCNDCFLIHSDECPNTRNYTIKLSTDGAHMADLIKTLETMKYKTDTKYWEHAVEISHILECLKRQCQE